MREFVDLNGNIEGENYDPENDAIGQEGEPSKNKGSTKRKMYSSVWSYFELREDEQGKGKQWAVCKCCGKKLTGGSKSGTTHLKNHIKRCSNREREFEESPSFDQGKSENMLAKMIILEELPFSSVERIGLRKFVGSLQPRFVMPDQKAVECLCWDIFEKRKRKLCTKLADLKCRASVTVDIIESGGHPSHLCLAAYLLDLRSINNRPTRRGYFPRRVILNFVELYGIHTGDALVQMIEEKLRDWNLDKNLCSIVSTYPTTSSKLVHELHSALASMKSILFSGGVFHVQSCREVINFIILGCIKALHEVTEKVRCSVKLIKASPEHLRLLEVFDCPILDLFDCLSTGKSVFHILHIARKFRGACASLHIPFPCSEEWENVRNVQECLKVCDEIRKLPSIWLHPTANLYFPKLCDLYLLLKEYCSSANQITASMAPEMMGRLKAYWDSNSLILSLASILDPTQKMGYIEYYFPRIYGEEESSLKIKDVQVNLRKLYEAYRRANESEPMSHIESSNPGLTSTLQSAPISESSSHSSLADIRKKRKEFLSQASSKHREQQSALDRYLEQEIRPQCSFEEVLNWWKGESYNSPALFLMASEVLGIPVSTTSVERAERFMKSINTYESLDPRNIEALMCAQDWLREYHIAMGLSPSEISAAASFEDEDNITTGIEDYKDDDDTNELHQGDCSGKGASGQMVRELQEDWLHLWDYSE